MTLKNLLCVAAAVALMTSSAMALSTTPADSAGMNTGGPVLSVDLLRAGYDASMGGASNTGLPVLGPNGGLQYIVFVTPDTSFGTFTGANAGPNGAGGSIGLELGISVPAGLATQVGAVDPVANVMAQDLTAVTVPANATPGTGATDTETVANAIDFGNPGNPIFGFEVPVFESNIATPGTPDLIGGVQVNTATDNDSIFAALGTTFFDTDDTLGGAGPYEVLRFETSRLTSSNLSHDVTLLGQGDLFDSGLANSLIAAQSLDLVNTPAQSTIFTPESVTESDVFVPGDTNLDGTVTVTDLTLLDAAFGTGTIWTDGDYNGDGTVSVTDLTILDANFGGSAAAPVVGGVVVPEPSSLVLLLVSGTSALAGRRRVD